MSYPLELKYNIKVVWDKQSGGVISFRDETLNLDMPETFGGKGRFPCPDEFFLAAIGGCYLTTFLYFKEKLNLTIHDLKIAVQGMVHYTGPQGYRIKEIIVALTVGTDTSKRTRAIECLEYTKQFCHLTRSIEEGIHVKAYGEIL